ncbi:MAG: CRTAC1 family protein [Pseudomonadota bacterium]
MVNQQLTGPMGVERVLAPRLVVLASVVPLAALGQGLNFDNVTSQGHIDLGAPSEGVSAIDVDLDGYMDLLVVRPDSTYVLWRNVEDPSRPGNRNFLDVTAGSGLDDTGLPRSNEVQAVVAADYDRDGDPDIYGSSRSVFGSRLGILFRNDAGQFSNVTALAGVELRNVENTSPATWSDVDLDGWPDLFIVTPEAENFRLLLNNGDGSFRDASDRVAAPSVPSYAYSALWTDVDLDGFADAVVGFQAGFMMILNNVAAEDGGRQLAAGQTVALTGISPMGIAAGDYDGDGDFDLAVSVDGVANGIVYRNDDGVFTAVTPFTVDCTWGVNWLDGDNDGDLDFFTAGDCHSNEFFPDFLIENLGGGQFVDVSTRLGSTLDFSYHSLVVDYNNDGRQDLVVNDPFAQVTVYENTSSDAGHWLKVKLDGRGNTNREGIGALVRVATGELQQVREVRSGSSVTATEDLRAHFGLGASASADWIEVVWPRAGALASRTQRFAGPFGADQILTLRPSVGGIAEGLDLTAARCLNRTTGESVVAAVAGDGSWDCEASGLVVGDEDRLIVLLRGIASADTASELRGGTTGFAARAVQCRNLSTGQTVVAPTDGAAAWDCASAGLTFDPGNQLVMLAFGEY